MVEQKTKWDIKPHIVYQEMHETQDIYEAAFLYASGFKLIGKRRWGTGRTYAIRFGGHGVTRASQKYYNNAKISALALSNSFKNLKEYLFDSGIKND